jgi:hypothetical protein
MIDLERGELVREVDGFPGYWVTSLGRVISEPNVSHKDGKACQGGY